jgi:hypothetical protein
MVAIHHFGGLAELAEFDSTYLSFGVEARCFRYRGHRSAIRNLDPGWPEKLRSLARYGSRPGSYG